MTVGRKPLPTATKELQGNPGKRALGTDTAKIGPAEDLTPPMPLFGAASREWNRVAPFLHRLGLVTELDLTTLAAYCEAWGRYVDAQADLRAYGAVVEGYRGGLVKNPAAQVARDALADMLKLAVEFGMTPSSRGRIHIPGEDEDGDGLDGILS